MRNSTSDVKEDEQTKSLANSAACLTPGGTNLHKMTKSLKIEPSGEDHRNLLSHGDVVSLTQNQEIVINHSDESQSKINEREALIRHEVKEMPDYLDEKVPEAAPTSTSGETFIKARNQKALISFGSGDEVMMTNTLHSKTHKEAPATKLSDVLNAVPHDILAGPAAMDAR